MRYLPFLLFILVVANHSSCNKNPCLEQYCLNGGDCQDGNCLCPTGWTGEHCEEATYTPPAYKCANGNCITDPNGIYSSLADCQNNCGNSGGNAGYNCSNGTCEYSNTNGQYSTFNACQNACSNNQVNLEFSNYTHTDLIINVNGITKVASPDQSVIFTGPLGSTAQVIASTSGLTSQGNTIGAILNWNFTRTFQTGPPINMRVTSEYFYLRLRNQSWTSLRNLYVNYGLDSETLDNILVPNNGTLYGIGYFKAWNNSNVRMYTPDGDSYVQWEQGEGNFILPFTYDQSVTLVAN